MVDWPAKIKIIATTFCTILLAGGIALTMMSGFMEYGGVSSDKFLYVGIFCIVAAIILFVFVKKGKE